MVDHNPNRVSDVTVVTFSVKCFYLLKLYHLSANIFRKWFASYFLFIHEHLIVIVISIGKHYCCHVRFTSLLVKNI